MERMQEQWIYRLLQNVTKQYNKEICETLNITIPNGYEELTIE